MLNAVSLYCSILGSQTGASQDPVSLHPMLHGNIWSVNRARTPVLSRSLPPPRPLAQLTANPTPPWPNTHTWEKKKKSVLVDRS